MQYQQPYGVSDPNAPYINGDPTIGRQGSIPPAAAFEENQREIVNVISLAGLTPNGGTAGVAGGDLTQLAKAIQSGKLNFAQDTGAQNAMVCVLAPVVTSYGNGGLVVRLQVLLSNINDATHTTLTLDAGGGPQPVIRTDGAMPATGELKAGGIYELVWSGTRFQIINFLGMGGTGSTTTALIKIPYVADTSAAANTITANFSPAITTVNAGDPFLVKLANNITGPTVININALAALSVVRRDLTALWRNDGLAGEILFMVADGTRLQLVNPPVSPQPILLAPINFYCDPVAGNDNNDGLSALTPFLTLQKAVNTIALYNLNGYNVTVNCASGTYAGTVSLKALSGSGAVTFIGNPSSPNNCGIHATSGVGIYCDCDGYTFNGFHIYADAPGASDFGSAVKVEDNGRLILYNIWFGPCYGWLIDCEDGGSVFLYGTMTIVGGCTGPYSAFILCSGNASVRGHPAIVIANPVSLLHFIYCNFGGVTEVQYTSLLGYGYVYGAKYFAQFNGIIVSGGDQNYYPGNIPGATQTGGWYVAT
jgi:hypothetical protein